MSRRAFLFTSGLIVLGALLLREWFVLTMVVPNPNQGDVGAYLRYAMHLAEDGTFSQATGPAVPDAFRSPGYPFLLSLLYPGTWEDGRWFSLIYQLQCLLGAATVAGVIALARTWLSRPWALLCGLWMAIQAHHVAATGAILTEVLFGLCIVLGLLYHQRKSGGITAGAWLGLGYLVNPVVAFLPFLLGGKRWLATCAVMLLCIGGWSLRNHVQDVDGGSRATMNFVQGSWRTYHAAHKWPGMYADTMRRIGEETALMEASPKAGLEAVGERLARDPWESLAWYASKPYLLWEWDIRIGQGQHYTIDQRHTITHSGIGLLVTVVQWTLNPLAFCLAFCGIVLGLARGGPLRMVAIAAIYFTAVHVVLQAEPRYAIPYRSLEILLAVSALAYLRELFPRQVRSPLMDEPMLAESRL
jgi:hypothetical protein